MMGAVAYLARPKKKNKWMVVLSLVGLVAQNGLKRRLAE